MSNSGSSFRSVLPREIIDLIIDCFRESPSDLRLVGLVHTLWYPRSRYRLFRRVELGDGNPQERCAGLKLLLRKNPSLSRFIIDLTIDADVGPEEGEGEQEDEDDDEETDYWA